MKKKHIYIYLLGMLLLSVGCTGKFREFNTDQSGITDDDLLIDDNGFGIRLGIIQQGIYFNYDFGKGKNWPFQLIQNLNADMFSGYMHDGKPLNGGTHNSDYNMQDGWNSAMWTHMYSYIFPQIYQSENATRDTEPALFGITKVLKVEVMHRVTDYYGPVIYKNFANAQNQYRPDTQKEVYYEFFNELDSAVVSLADYIEKKPESNGFTRFDILLDGQYSSWIKFANSLRMRLAMRISAVDPDKARTEFLKGLENEFGVFEAEDERVAVSTKSGFTNPLGELNRVWNETYMSAAMESILTGYDDPRLKVYFETCTDKAYAGEYRGIRQGTCFAHNHYAGLSKLSVDQSTDAPLMSSAEVWFLRAEAALLAARKNKKAITMEEIEEATIKVVVGAEKKTRVMSDKEKKLTAYHEAGHAICFHELATQDPVHEISIIPRGMAGGYTMPLPSEDKSYNSRTEMLEDIVVCLGGRVAEAIILDDISTGASNDIEKATKTARDMVTKYGMTKELGCICYGKDNSAVFLGRDMGHTQDYSEQTAAKIDELILEIVNNAYDRAETILKDNIDKLHEVAAYLIKHEKMGGEDFEAVMNGTYVEPVEAEDAESEEDNANTAENKDNE